MMSFNGRPPAPATEKAYFSGFSSSAFTAYSSHSPVAIFSTGPSYRYHLPSLVMPMGTISYFDVSTAPITDVADSLETSCSSERPPKIIPSFIILTSFSAMSGRNFSFPIRSRTAPLRTARRQRTSAVHLV